MAADSSYIEVGILVFDIDLAFGLCHLTLNLRAADRLQPLSGPDQSQFGRRSFTDLSCFGGLY